MSCCANHTCAKSLDLNGQDANVLCPLCVDTELVYCSEQCRVMDWVTHKCNNAFLVKTAMMVGQSAAVVFAPYHFEDTLDEKEYKRLQDTLSQEHVFQMENQRYLVQNVAPDLTVTQHLIGNDVRFKPMDPKLQTVYRRGKEPEARLKSLPYTIEIEGVDANVKVMLEGTIEADSIYKNHLAWLPNPNKALDWLLNRRKESSSIVLFPRVQMPPEQRAFPPTGTLSVTVKVDGKVVTQWENASYTMRTRGYEFTRALGKFLTPRLKALFPGADAARKDMKLLRAQVGSTSLVLVFNVPRMEKEFMRLEGVIYTVSETNLLRAAFGTGMGAGKPAPLTPIKRPEVVVTRPSVVVVDDTSPPLSPRDTEEPFDPYGPSDPTLPPPPLPPSDIEPDVVEERGEFSVSPIVSPGAAPPAPLPPSAVPVRPGRTTSAEDLVGGAQKLKKTQVSTTARKPVVATSSKDEEQAEIVKLRPSVAGEDGDDDWPTEAEIRRQILFSPFSGTGAEKTVLSLECDASNLAHVTGLAMALDYRTALGDKTLESLEHVTALIQQHGRALASGKEVDVSIPVSTAIYTALDTLNQQYY